MPGLWIAALSISPRVREKVASRHGIQVDELRAHLVGARGLVATWEDHPARGRRALVMVLSGRRRVLAVLYPAPDLGDDAYRLASAYPV